MLNKFNKLIMLLKKMKFRIKKNKKNYNSNQKKRF